MGRSLGKESPQGRGTPAFGHVAGAPYRRAEERKGSAAHSPLVSDPFMPREGGSTGASVVRSGRCPHRCRCRGGGTALLALHQLTNTRSRFMPTLSSQGAQGRLSSPSFGTVVAVVLTLTPGCRLRADKLGAQPGPFFTKPTDTSCFLSFVLSASIVGNAPKPAEDLGFTNPEVSPACAVAPWTTRENRPASLGPISSSVKQRLNI